MPMLFKKVVNAVIDVYEIIYPHFVDTSIAVATSKGLVVPVLCNVELINYAQIENELAALEEKDRNNRLALGMDEGTFTISSGGVFGSVYGRPEINPYQSAILGIHGIFDRPVAINGKVKGGGYRAEMQGEWEGGESNSNTHKKQSQRYCEKDNFGDNVEGGRKEDGGWVGRDNRHDLQKRKDISRSTAEAIFTRLTSRDRKDGGLEGGNSSSPEVIADAELRAIRLKRIQEQFNDFDSDVSPISPPKRRKYTDREVNKFQMEVLKEERALIAKKSLFWISNWNCLAK
ncbi:unnamed protein product [Cylicocyclus nassatus]|uniref:Dihydrolipoyllysine-residue succinyltransferase component of 2-oxoglutarate dehydrogenase complex, mitochondrial n=1 Tax=Cylicocyclus nassatus TaxID=53992 RepID=A0AA36H9K8_CYLNA|nr:unnamed protein product [Cylicocyclus nassatus]